MATMGKLKVSLIVLNYKGLGQTLDFLDSAARLNVDGFKLETLVVDNGSKDGSEEALSKLKNINFIETDENLGYAGGMNVGIKYALKHGSDFVILINNDTVCDKELVADLVKAAKKHDIICPKIYFAPGYEFHKTRYKKQELGHVIWYAGGEIDWQNVIGIHTGVDEVDKNQYPERVITFATGCCMLVKRQVFEKIGLLDEKYFLYLEDMDFSHRAIAAGFKILFKPSAVLWHKNASSAGGSGSILQDYYFTRNRLLFAFKYANWKTKLAILKHIAGQISNPIRRKALVDFLTFKYGKQNF